MTVVSADSTIATGTLASDAAADLTAFARACKAAARTVAIYPPEHPTVGIVLDALTGAARRATAMAALRLAVLPESLTIDGRGLARPDTAVSEFAALLHAHQVAQLVIHPLTDADLWRRFLALLALPPDHARLRGGLGKLWISEGQTRIEVHSLDYRARLRDCLTGDRATWESIVAHCFEGNATTIDDSIVDLLFDILDDPTRVRQLVRAVEERIGPGAAGGPMVIASLLHAVAQYVSRTNPEQADAVLSALAEATGRLPVETLAPIVRARHGGSRPELSRFITTLLERIKDGTIAEFIASEVREGRGTSPRLAEAFCGLAPDVDRRAAILTLARQSLDRAGATADPALARSWQQSEELFLAYSGREFISDAYNAELEGIADRAVDLDRDPTDPPERLAAWRQSVGEKEIGALDGALLVDLMQLQLDAARWRGLADLTLNRVNVLLVLGDFDAAAFLIAALRSQGEHHADADIRAAAGAALTHVLTPAMMRHVAVHLDTADRSIVAAAERFCAALGTGAVGPLAEVLSREERGRPRQYLIEILIGFGAAGRQVVERLRQAPNAAVRRTAVLLLREFGGHDALGELESLLNDSEPHVQREATRAIAMMGIEAAYATLIRALDRGTDRARTSIMGVLWTLPDEEAAQVLSHLVMHAPCRGALWSLHERAIPRLGAIGGQSAISGLAAVLERKQAWAPFRMAALRRSAVTALVGIGTPEALAVLDQIAAAGPRRLRAVARAHVAAARGAARGSLPA